MSQYQYKSKNGADFFIPGIGATVDGILTSDVLIENPNLELIENAQPEPAQAPQPEAPVAQEAPAPLTNTEDTL